MIPLCCNFDVTGVNEPYDQALDDIKACKSWLDQYLDKQRKRLNCRVSKNLMFLIYQVS